MKFSILQQDLMPVLSAVSRSCSVRAQLPVLGNILLQTDQGRLKLSATNLEVGIIKLVKAEIIEEGEITVPAKTLVEIIANLGGEKIDFATSGEVLKLTTITFSSQISGISASEFPTIPLTGKNEVIINPETLQKSLPQVTFAAAVEDGRPILTGILTEIKDKKLQLVATDGYRLAHKTVAVEEAANFKALVPRRTFEEIIHLIAEEDIDNIKISTSEDQNQMIFTLGNTQLSSRLIEGNFPAWEKIIPKEFKARVILDRAEALKAVKLASVFSRNEANVVKLHSLPGKLVITSEARELGNQQKELEVQSEGEEIQVSFNAKFLQDALAALSCSQVVLEFSGNLSAAVLKPMGEDGLEYIIMPVNLS